MALEFGLDICREEDVWIPLRLGSKLGAFWDPPDFTTGATTWIDRGPNAVVATVAGGAPTASTVNGAPAVNLGGSEWFTYPNALLGAKNFSIALCVQFSTTSTAAFAFSTGADISKGVGLSSHGNGDGKREIFAKGVGVSTGGASTTNPEVWVCTFDNAVPPNSTLRVNGVAETMTAPTVSLIAPDAGGQIGARRSTGFSNMRGKIGPIVLTVEPLTTSERDSLEWYLKSYWKL